MKARLRIVRVFVYVLEAPGVERARAADDPVHLVAPRQQELRKVRPVLPGDSRDQRPLRHPPLRSVLPSDFMNPESFEMSAETPLHISGHCGVRVLPAGAG